MWVLQFVSHSFDAGIKLELTETLAQTLFAATMLRCESRQWVLSASRTQRCCERGEGCLCSADWRRRSLSSHDTCLRGLGSPLCNHFTFCIQLHMQYWDGKWGEKKIEVKQKWPPICFQCQGTSIKSKWMRESKGIDIECEDRVPSPAYFHL